MNLKKGAIGLFYLFKPVAAFTHSVDVLAAPHQVLSKITL
jgi:hypothetical protein